MDTPATTLGERFARYQEQLEVITGLWDVPDGGTFSFSGSMLINAAGLWFWSTATLNNWGLHADGWLSALGESLHVTGQVFRLVGNNLAHYRPWEIGEQFLAKDKEGNAKQWDPADIGRIVNRYVFQSENPGIDAQRRA